MLLISRQTYTRLDLSFIFKSLQDCQLTIPPLKEKF